MNILKLLDRLSDDSFFTRQASRSETLSDISAFGKKAAVAALPLGLAGLMSTSAKAETLTFDDPITAKKDALTDALQLALVLEYLEDEYYRVGLNSGTLIPTADRTVFMQISNHEAANVAFFRTGRASCGERG